MKFFFTIFVTVFLAELGDKTQLAAMLYSSQNKSSTTMVFLAASSALVVSTFIGVFLGKYLGQWIPEQSLKIAAGVAFIAVGIWTLVRG